MSVWAGDFSFFLSLSLSLSLVARTFWHINFFKHFIFGFLRPFCHFEPLQKGDPTGCKAQAAAKKSKEFKIRFVFGYFANAQYDKAYQHYTKSVWYDKTNRYDKFRLSPKFFRTKEKFEKFKEFAIFLKKFLLEVQKRHYVSRSCVTMRLFKRKFAL